MTNDTKNQPAPIADIASFLTSPSVLLTVFAAVLLLAITARAEAAALSALTPAWFMPAGAAVAGLGLVATAVFLVYRSASAMHFLGLFTIALAPAIVWALFAGDMAAVGVITGSQKLTLGIMFATIPWLLAAVSWFERQTISHAA
ncbi:hypothetical protein LMG29542_02501 [Paraburkholderia humisilvae]|uniref:Uncharacterized protein n=2 Tax=Paraburkholderia humisilvae TaxID=627669 RepID=A0A6J5DLX0_9BURK|nr:hypothetical protein LMG29542_02501 [Paraburkholderia humisilvae]